MTAGNYLLHRATSVSFPAEHIQQHRVTDLKAGRQPFWRGGNQSREGVLVPVDEIVVRRLAFRFLFSVLVGFLRQLEVLDGVFRRLGDHPAAVVESLSSGPAGNLMKITCAENAGLLTVEFAQLCEK